jgi:hypothetical protein
MREFHLSPPGKGLGVSCDAEGVFVGAIPLLNRLRKSVGELLNCLAHMMLAAPKFKDKTG